MTGIQLPGLATGLDSASLIASLMQLYTAPENVIKAKITTDNSKISDLQYLNTQIAALKTAADVNAKPAALAAFTASASNPAITAKAGSGATPGSIDISVTQLAQAQTSVTGTYTNWPDNPPTLTIVNSSGVQTQVTAVTTSLDDVVVAINNSAAGVTAQKIATGTDGSGNPLYRLQLTSKQSGAAGAFQIYRGSTADLAAGTATDLMSDPGAATIKVAQDASATLWAGTAAQQTVTSSSNTFTNLLPGVDVTATAVTSAPTTLTVSADVATSSKTADTFVTSIGTILANILNGQKTATSTDATGATTTKLGTFTGDSNIRAVNDSLISAATDPVNGVSPSSIGINISVDGNFNATVTFDPDKFAAAMASDPDGTQSMFNAISARVSSAANLVSDPFQGTLSSEIKNAQSEVSDLNDQVASWDTRLAARQAALQQTYAALEVAVNKLNAQGSYLTQQLAGLTNSSSSSSK
ncbi:flagellar filament capping protein FliD [Diaminobutyricibacter tongyongensis]|uniref:Flagellar hook-associated protein 2 n=1 Tax=Leifsonia tongyongensis TaxID=1268043 RepID=A0A6L9XV95_9MICO|nr:flagellar filament capping protein FliD [Diaminobutyricibacter tongyongensis]